MKELIVVMPIYNEEAGVEAVLKKWCDVLTAMGIDFEIHAYNDGSKDQSGRILERLGRENPRVIAHNEQNSGHGPTILKGYLANVERSEWLFQIDSDDEMGPESFRLLWEERRNYDFLIGRRDGRLQPLARRVTSATSRWTVWLLFGRGVWDVNSPYRLMRARVFKALFDVLPPRTFAPNVIISAWAGQRHLHIFEHPVPCRERRTGQVSVCGWKLVRAAVRSFGQTVAFRFGRRYP